MVRVLITSTQPRADEFVSDLKLSNIDAYSSPSLIVKHIDSLIPTGDFDAMLISSHHVFHSKLPNLPIIAVGQKTADLAKSKGYTVIKIGNGGVQDIDLSNYKSVLYPCAKTPSFIPNNAIPWVTYETHPNPDFNIGSDTDIICLFSVNGALNFIDKCDCTSVKKSTIICLSEKIADVLTTDFYQELAVCQYPQYDAMKNLILQKIKRRT